MIALTTELNKPGMLLAKLSGVHAPTDITGFGLAGHLLEMARGFKLKANLEWKNISLIDEALSLIKSSIYTGAFTRNWSAYGDEFHLLGILEWQKNVLNDSQISGGLLIFDASDSEAEILKIFYQDEFIQTQKIGNFTSRSGLLVT